MKQKLTIQVEYEGPDDVTETDAYHDLTRAASDLAYNHNVDCWVEDEDGRTRTMLVAIFPSFRGEEW